MTMQNLIDEISDVSDQSIFVSFNPDILDFTNKESSKEIVIHLQNNKTITIPIKDDTLSFLISILKVSLFSKGMKIICWNWKSFCSFVLHKTGKEYLVSGSIIDLKVIESYLGIKNKAPKNIKDALFRLKKIVGDGSWKSIESIYKNLHLKLITNVIPGLENSGVISTSQASRVFANYDINGQENGRLLCSNCFEKGFVPHAMGPELRSNIKPLSLNDYFMSFDFRAMEVFMLAWLSNDERLLEVCKSKDVYYSLYEIILQKSPEKKSDRIFIKKCFLPVIYGQSSYSLGQQCGIPKDSAESIINRINSLFSVSASWICNQEQNLKNSYYAKDFFGKRRLFEEGKEYMVRNFCIQSPAATVCLEKLCDLFYALKNKTSIAFMVHDSYTIYFNKENWKDVYSISEQILTGESSFCSNLKLKVSCRVGRDLNSMKNFKPKEIFNVGDMQ